VLQIGLAVLHADGLRVDSRGGHLVLALQTVGKSIGVSADAIRLLDGFSADSVPIAFTTVRSIPRSRKFWP
jgi:hypothetical protein